MSRMPTGTALAPDAARIFPSRGARWSPPHWNANEHDLGAVFVALGNFVRDARERALDGGGIKDDGGFRHGN